ncbi:hypothetical protein ARMSODRAFT_978496 [Armillaria solidipes]|uniref:Uncharacterized protein n=1 Tax=Armillaria solidipes TaxID=1076256 RepID=A0A2H3B2B9_9AGAR|nr:hypothetical protein ARMSODRAFT_978496 [Armillaria solidipes]
MLAAIFGACGMAPPPPEEPPRLRDFVFDVVAFRDMLIRNCPKQWASLLADVRVLTNRQRLSFDFKPSPADPGRLIEVTIPGTCFELEVLELMDWNEDRAKARLENEAWIQPKSVRPWSVQCFACKKEVPAYRNRPEYDMRRWQDHRDYCSDIKHQIKVSILKALLPRQREFIYPPNSKDPIEIIPPEMKVKLPLYQFQSDKCLVFGTTPISISTLSPRASKLCAASLWPKLYTNIEGYYHGLGAGRPYALSQRDAITLLGWVFCPFANYEQIHDTAKSELSMITRGYGGRVARYDEGAMFHFVLQNYLGSPHRWLAAYSCIKEKAHHGYSVVIGVSQREIQVCGTSDVPIGPTIGNTRLGNNYVARYHISGPNHIFSILRIEKAAAYRTFLVQECFDGGIPHLAFTTDMSASAREYPGAPISSHDDYPRFLWSARSCSPQSLKGFSAHVSGRRSRLTGARKSSMQCCSVLPLDDPDIGL